MRELPLLDELQRVAKRILGLSRDAGLDTQQPLSEYGLDSLMAVELRNAVVRLAGQNLPVTPQQIRQGLGADTVGELASKAGISQDQATSQLSELLPKLVDKLTPDGKIPQGDLMSKGMDILKGLMK